VVRTGFSWSTLSFWKVHETMSILDFGRLSQREIGEGIGGDNFLSMRDCDNDLYPQAVARFRL
jgi:hypothetical protein